MRSIRLACPGDAAACLSIYAPLVERSAVSFETEVPKTPEFGERIRTTLETHPWLVSVAGDRVTGYAYAGQIRKRAAYRWSVEVSAYVNDDHRGRGTGRRLYESLFACLRHQGFASAYAGITLPNDASVAFHESLGFEKVGVYRYIGYKFGVWHDVGWWQQRLIESSSPQEPVPLSRCRDEIESLLERLSTD